MTNARVTTRETTTRNDGLRKRMTESERERKEKEKGIEKVSARSCPR